mgnify:CR=1 FL=1
MMCGFGRRLQRKQSGCKNTGIPVRTLEDWEAARRTPPEYIPRLIDYQLKYEKLMQEKEVKNAEE